MAALYRQLAGSARTEYPGALTACVDVRFWYITDLAIASAHTAKADLPYSAGIVADDTQRTRHVSDMPPRGGTSEDAAWVSMINNPLLI